MQPPTLWQFRFSHFNEKVRWALDHKGIMHVRRSLVPGLHIPRVLWLTGQKSLPVLVMSGQVVRDSTAIIAALERFVPDPPLYPADPAERARALALEDFLDEELGPYLRRAAFHHLLAHPDYCVAMFTTGTGALTRKAYGALFPAIAAAMRRDMQVTEAGTAEGQAKVAAAFDRLEAELGSRRYLVGDRFTVADLTAAAMLSPIVTPAEYPYPLPGPLPGGAGAWRATLADRPAFRWVEEIYRRHRGRSTAIAA